MKFIKLFLVLCSIFKFSLARRPFVDPAEIRSRIFAEFAPYFSTAQNKFNEMDDVTAYDMFEGIKPFPDTLVNIRNSLTRRFDRLSCGYCRNILSRYHIECNVNVEIIWEVYSYQRIRIRLEKEIQDNSERMLKPIRNFMEELRDYKSNYVKSDECWSINKNTLFDMLHNTHTHLTTKLNEIIDKFHESCKNTSSRFENRFENVNDEVDLVCSSGNGFGLCEYLYVSNNIILLKGLPVELV